MEPPSFLAIREGIRVELAASPIYPQALFEYQVVYNGATLLCFCWGRIFWEIIRLILEQ
jgi:hypothetical protein